MAKRASPKVTITDLARRLKLSPGAVSQALNGTPSTIRVSPETIKRVQQMAEKLGYRPNRAARILRTGRSGMVGILLHQGFSPLTPLHLYHARANAERIGLVPFVYEVVSSKPDAEALALEFILDSKVDALMVLGWSSNRALLRDAGVPVAVIGRPIEPVVPTYFVDQPGGYRMAAEHLLEQGHQRLALVTEKKTDTYFTSSTLGVERAVRAARRKGRKASWSLHLAEVEYDEYMAKGVPHLHGLYAAGYVGMKSILASGELPDAIVFRSDTLVQGALRACKEAGVRVPEDLAMTGFGDDPSSSAGILSITSVTQPLEEIQRAAFDDIRRALDGEPVPQDRYLEFPCQLVVRESSLRPKRSR